MSDGETGVQSGTGANTQSGGAGSTEGTSTSTSTGTGTQSGTTTNTTSTEDTVSRTDFEAVTRRMQAADKRASDFENKLKELQTKDLPEAEKLKAEHEAAVQQVVKLTETNRKLSLENAFLKDNTHEWQNPAAALKMADLSGVTVNEDGSVTGLKDALKRLANSEAWMLKPKAASEGAAAAGGANPPGSAAVPPMNGRPDGTANAARGMESRLPALMTRRRPKAT